MSEYSAKSFAINHRFPTSLPITLQRRGIRIRPTGNGVIFIVLVLSMFLGSLNYNNNLGFLLTFLLGSIAFVSIATTYKNVCGITIGSSFSQPVFAGQKAVFEFIISGAPQTGFALALLLKVTQPFTTTGLRTRITASRCSPAQRQEES